MRPYGYKPQDGGPCLDCGHSHAIPTGSRARFLARLDIADQLAPEPAPELESATVATRTKTRYRKPAIEG